MSHPDQNCPKPRRTADPPQISSRQPTNPTAPPNLTRTVPPRRHRTVVEITPTFGDSVTTVGPYEITPASQVPPPVSQRTGRPSGRNEDT